MLRQHGSKVKGNYYGGKGTLQARQRSVQRREDKTQWQQITFQSDMIFFA
jgi:hypothetical protein